MEHPAKIERQESTNNFTIDLLDEYSLLGIFSYLKPSDLLSTAQVCRKWEQFSLEAWRNVSISQFYAFMKQQETTDDVKKLFPCLKYIPHITMAFKRHLPAVLKKDFTKLINQILEILSESTTNKLKSFTWNVRVSRNLVQKFLKANIRNLEVINIDNFNRIDTSADFNNLLQCANNLKEFNWYIKTEKQQAFLLSTIQSLPKTLRILRMYILQSVSEPISAELVLKHLKCLQQLDILVLSGLDFKLKNTAPPDAAVKFLSLSLLQDSIDYSILPIDPELKDLVLEGGLLTNENVDFILKNYSSLESIRLAYIRVTEAQIGRLSKLSQLKSLSVTHVHHWTGSTLKFFINLEELDISECIDFEENFLFDWLYTAKNLKYLSLNEKEFEWDALKKHLKKSHQNRIHSLAVISRDM